MIVITAIVGGIGVQPALGGMATLDELAADQVPRPIAGRTSSWVAEPIMSTAVRSAPGSDAPVIGRVEPVTPYSGDQSGFLVNGAVHDVATRGWVRIQLARRPNGVTGWVRGDAVFLTTTEDRIHVRLGARRLDYWRHGKQVASFPAGIGKPRTPTPRGRFAVEDRVVTAPSDRPMYGRQIITLTAHSTVVMRLNGGDGQIAIHGTGSPGRIGRPSSHGCVVVGDDALDFLVARARTGTPVLITD